MYTGVISHPNRLLTQPKFSKKESIQPYCLFELVAPIINFTSQNNWSKSISMVHSTFFALLTITITILSFTKKIVPNCECTDFVNFFRQGNCQTSNIDKSDDKLCYVKVPSKCPDVKNSSLFLGKQISKRACDLHSLHIELKSNGAKIREISYCVFPSIFIKLTLQIFQY